LPQLQFHRRNHISQFTDMSQKVILAALERADSDPQLLDLLGRAQVVPVLSHRNRSETQPRPR
jgi:hypothetical protein